MRITTSRAAMNMVEVIVVMAILSILMMMLLPAIQHVRRAADIIQCKNHLRQLGLAFHHRQAVAGAFTSYGNRGKFGKLSWLAHQLPELGYDSLLTKAIADLDISTDTDFHPAHTVRSSIVPLFVCPTDTRLLRPIVAGYGVSAAYTSYIGVVSVEGNQPILRGRPVHFLTAPLGMSRPSLPLIRDGLSHTAMVSERPPPDVMNVHCGKWYPSSYSSSHGQYCEAPQNLIILSKSLAKSDSCCEVDCRVTTNFGPGRLENPCDRFHLWSLHGRGANFLFADGSVRFLGYSAEPIIASLFSVQGGEAVDLAD